MGAWIEISMSKEIRELEEVAPLVGAWIEISMNRTRPKQIVSLLSWERGLK